MAEPKIEKDERDLKKETAAKEAMRTEPAAGERTTRQGAAVDTEPVRLVVTERPVTGAVVPPGVTTTTPLKPYGTVDDTTVRHARDETVHPDWERQPQINAPQDVGVPTPEGQADAARIRAGRRRGDEVTVPPASSANVGTMKRKARDIEEDVDRRI